jgi:YVTN family beta-propeller protein
MKKIFLLLILSFSLFACDTFTGESSKAATGVYVVNQGNFGQNNGTITLYNLTSQAAIQDAIPNLTTLPQSLAIGATNGYITANTSDRVDIFSLKTNARTAQVTNVPSPRYVKEANGKLYASNLYQKSISVIDLGTNKVSKTLTVGDNPETMALVGSRLFVANSGFGAGKTLSVVDVQTDAVTETVNLNCDGVRFVMADKQGEIWAICNGNTVYSPDFSQIISKSNGEVVVLNGSNGQVVKRFPLDSQCGSASFGQDAYYASDAEELYVVKGKNIVRFNTATNAQAETIAISGNEGIGGVAYDAKSQRLFIARLDATNPYSANGSITIHDKTGLQLGKFVAGVVPSHIEFSTN